jgi:hypothetical protein
MTIHIINLETRSIDIIDLDSELIESLPFTAFVDGETVEDISDDEDLCVEYDETLTDDCVDFYGDPFRDEQESDLAMEYAA